jgi:hypothetical protein
MESRAPLAQDLREYLNTLARAEGRSLESAKDYL